MRFTSAVLFTLPLLSVVQAVPRQLAARQGNRFGANGNGGNGNNNNNNGNGNNNNGGNNNNNNNNANDPNNALFLLQDQVSTNFANDGQDPPVVGQVASLTSTNNFIGFCGTVNFPLTNGQQRNSPSCNPTIMGTLPASNQMPSCAIQSPDNFSTLPANQPIQVELLTQKFAPNTIHNLQTNFHGVPQQLNGQGLIQGHAYLVVDQINGLTDTQPTNPQNPAFHSLFDRGQGNTLSVTVPALAAGTYRMMAVLITGSGMPAQNPIAQRGLSSAGIYITVN